MALNIPNTDLPGTSFLKGVDTGSSMFSRLIQPVLERERQKQQAEQFAQKLALSKQAAARAGANSGLQMELLKQKIMALKDKNDPNRINKLLNSLDDNTKDNLKPTSSEEMPSHIPSIRENSSQGSGQENYGINPNSISEYEAYQNNSNNKSKSIFDKEYIKKALIYKSLGIPVPKESTSGYTPELRQKEYDYKIKSLNERIRHNLEQEKLADPEGKIHLADEKAKIEADKQKLINDHKAQLEYSKSLNKEEGKNYSKMQEEAIGGIKSQPILDEIKDIVSNPVLEQIRQHPYAGHYELSYYRRSGTPEQKALIARFDIAANKLIADTAKGLNTRFTDKDLALAREMKINDSDSLDAIKSKAESLIYLHEIGQQRLDKALEIASTERISPYAAIKKADKEIDGNKIREHIKKQISGLSDSLPAGITEDDIEVTHKATGLSRKQILDEYKRKHGG